MLNSPTKRVLSLVVMLVGLFIACWMGPRALVEAGATADWPSVAGEVVSCEVTAPTKTGGSWRVAMFYAYQLGEARYRSNRWDVHGEQRFSSRGAAEAAAAAYAVGAPIEVLYDPENPSSSVLVAGGKLRAWGLIGFGLLIALAGARGNGRIRLRKT
jgi:hypothetical protein